MTGAQDHMPIGTEAKHIGPSRVEGYEPGGCIAMFRSGNARAMGTYAAYVLGRLVG